MDEALDRDLEVYGWERLQGTLGETSRGQLKDAVDAWLSGELSMADAARSVRALVPVDPKTMPLDPRKARIVGDRLYRRQGKRWLAADGTAMPVEGEPAQTSDNLPSD